MRMGRPPVALGIWPDMIQAAGGVRALARRLGVSERSLQWVFTGQRSLRSSNATTARAFARLHEIPIRVFRHPSSHGALLVSSASGWFLVPAEPGGWERATVARRCPAEDWYSLPALEVDFASIWPSISPGDV